MERVLQKKAVSLAVRARAGRSQTACYNVVLIGNARQAAFDGTD